MTDFDEKRYMNYIDGKWAEPATGRYYKVKNPADVNETVGEFPISNDTDVNAAVEAAHNRFVSWKMLAPSKRTEFIEKFMKVLDENKERLAMAATKEQGKIYKESLAEAGRGVKETAIIIGEALRLEGIFRPCDSERTVNYAQREPIGVIAAITPWNFPILTPIRKIIPALVAGCCVVFKPASSTPLTAVIIAQLFDMAGFPNGAVNLIIGTGKSIGDTLISNPKVRGVSFTGSTYVGRHINKIAASDFTKTQLEMGGKNAAVVVDYEDLDSVASGIVKAAFTNAGQRCTSISRVIVLEKQAKELEKLIIEKTSKLTVGDGNDETSDLGPVINENALNTIDEYITSAKLQGAFIAHGGTKLTGGIYDKGYYYMPTIITNVNRKMRVAVEEIFGPVLAIIPVATPQEAIDVCNDTEYGLTASLFSDNMKFIYDFIQNSNLGMVRINNLGVSGGNMPFGGTKNSGHGPFSIGHTNMDFYTKHKIVYIQY